MKALSYKEELMAARESKYAVGAFNIFNYIAASAAIKAAEELQRSIIIQTSTSVVKRYGVKETGKLLRMLADNSAVNVWIHLDHCTSVSLAKDCIDSGWDSVMIDASHLPLKDNIEITKEVVEYAHAKGVYVEGELGTIEGVEDEISADTGKKASFEESMVYLKETSIDAFAPAVGTAHGMYCGDPEINFELIEKLRYLTECPVVIHGGTGLSDFTFRELVQKGAAKINVSTAIKHAYLKACKEYFEGNPEAANPLDLDAYIFENIKETVKNHISLFAPGKTK